MKEKKENPKYKKLRSTENSNTNCIYTIIIFYKEVSKKNMRTYCKMGDRPSRCVALRCIMLCFLFVIATNLYYVGAKE